MSDIIDQDAPLDPDVQALQEALAETSEASSDDHVVFVTMTGEMRAVAVDIRPYGQTRHGVERAALVALQRGFDTARDRIVERAVEAGWMEAPEPGEPSKEEGVRATVGLVTVVVGTDMRPLRVELAELDEHACERDLVEAWNAALELSTPFAGMDDELKAEVDGIEEHFDSELDALSEKLDAVDAQLDKLLAQLDGIAVDGPAPTRR